MEGCPESVRAGIADEFEAPGVGEEGLKLLRKGCLAGFEFTTDGMGETETPGMQHETPGFDRLSIGLRIDGIAYKGTAEVFHVDANLVGAAGVQVAEDKSPGRGFVSGKDVVVGNGGSSRSRPRIEDGLLLAVHGMTSDVGEDGAGGLHWGALGDRQVELGGLAGGELPEERLEAAIGSGGHDAATRFLVEPVHDSGTLHAAHSRQVSPAMVKEGIDEGAIGVACRGMDDQTHRFVDDDDVFVLMKDVEGNVLREKVRRLGVGKLHGDGVTGRDRGSGLRPAAVEEDVTVLQESLDARAGKVGKFPGEEQIEPFSAVSLDGDSHGWRVGQDAAGSK